ncbi:LLM class F420-dependent oxidoreductase [Myceligenerans pegani]|uniref:LLM class F420-dependent oxidoreductase n=1 Tax=Myceligenerans pegani TaxID=2776917 RepID=A0ABR9MUN5_9MICO|nr:LLM class F420-dependent oxidoreductase [Myceligenerans sp. TRM 65318]MBE1875088.1 LLM class F420-dependent oxidoreductase [Myceligenerans sp. TRM 65318]MBE3017359.1 LLM class F420-dependent oxidoreductase [Myceligenerans sp. TRM 65318]
MSLDLRIFTEPQQGASYDDQLAVAKATEELGFSAFFRSDHYLAMGGADGLPGPTDAWTTLAGLARETETVRLGTLVSSATFRHPGVLAIQVAQVDQMSGGRVELGLGTGWFGAEHAAYGIPFPDKRFGILEEQLAVVTGLWGTPQGETFSHAGEHYTLTDSPALPKPVQDCIPVIVGGGGPRRTPALAARFADEYNQAFPEIDTIGPRIKVIEQALSDAGRGADSMVQSAALVVAVGADEAEFAKRAAAIGREPAELREHGVAGTVAEAADRLRALEKAGVSRVYLQVLDLKDLDHLDLIAREVRPQLD